MGLFDKVKTNLDTTLEKGKEISKDMSEKKDAFQTKQKEKEEIKKQKKIDKILEKYNIFEGIRVKATFPQEELVIKSHGGVTRGAATLGFGLIGLAATSRTKHKKQKITKNTILQVVEKGIVFQKATNEGKDFRIPYDNIVKLSIATIKGLRGEKEIKNQLVLNLLENQEIQIMLIGVPIDARNQLLNIVNGRATGKENEESGWGLESTNTALPETELKVIGENSPSDELEKIVKMYTDGLLTDEEFATMKKKIIEK